MIFSTFPCTSALPMGFLPDSHMHKTDDKYTNPANGILDFCQGKLLTPAKFGADRSINSWVILEQTNRRQTPVWWLKFRGSLKSSHDFVVTQSRTSHLFQVCRQSSCWSQTYSTFEGNPSSLIGPWIPDIIWEPQLGSSADRVRKAQRSWPEHVHIKERRSTVFLLHNYRREDDFYMKNN